MNSDSDSEDEELFRLRERYDELDEKAREWTEKYWKRVDDYGERWKAAGAHAKDPRNDPEVVELEKMRMEIAHMFYAADDVQSLIRQRAPRPSWVRRAFDSHRSILDGLPPRPEFQAKRDERRRRTEAIDELGGKLISHRLALAHLDKQGPGELETEGRLEKQRAIVLEASKNLEAEINRLSAIDSVSPGESLWQGNWQEIMEVAVPEFVEIVTKERDLILERAKVGEMWIVGAK